MDPDTDVVEVDYQPAGADKTGDVTEAPPEEQVVEVGVDPYSEDRLVPAGSNTPPQFIQDQGEDNKKVETRLALLAQQSKDGGHFDYDRDWYNREGKRVREAAHRKGVTEDEMLEITALLSPRMKWDKRQGDDPEKRQYLNIAAAERAIDLHRLYPDMPPEQIIKQVDAFKGVGGLPGSYKKAIYHLRGEDQDHGPKTWNFWHNLKDPEGTRDMVTIDTLMASALAGRPLGSKDEKQLSQINTVKKTNATPGGYGWAQRRIHAVAKQIGITPQELQAVIWSEWRRQHPQKGD